VKKGERGRMKGRKREKNVRDNGKQREERRQRN
jgi:hypothetical protein